VIDISTQIDAIHRHVERQESADGEVVSVLLRREYDAPIEDVWDAIANPDRMRRWFLPVIGDLREGGDFQLEGNAGGRILRCDPPLHLKVTFGSESSIVEVRLQREEDRTIFELQHTVPIAIAQSGAGALYVGPGWDGAAMALGLFLDGQLADDPVAAANSREGQEFSRHSVEAWTTTVEASGTADPDDIAAAVGVSLAQFAPDLADPSDQNSSS
jgi:uncharacterized protein YndB with AHSA1/START domain